MPLNRIRFQQRAQYLRGTVITKHTFVTELSVYIPLQALLFVTLLTGRSPITDKQSPLRGSSCCNNRNTPQSCLSGRTVYSLLFLELRLRSPHTCNTLQPYSWLFCIGINNLGRYRPSQRSFAIAHSLFAPSSPHGSSARPIFEDRLVHVYRSSSRLK